MRDGRFWWGGERRTVGGPVNDRLAEPRRLFQWLTLPRNVRSLTDIRMSEFWLLKQWPRPWCAENVLN
jgi:hypothetical protein